MLAKILFDDLHRILFLPIDCIVQVTHVFGADLPGQPLQPSPDSGIRLERLRTNDWNCLVRREVMLIILQYDQSERRDQAICIRTGDDINLLALQCAIEKAEVHNPRRLGELKAISFHQPGVSVRSFAELIANAHSHVRSDG